MVGVAEDSLGATEPALEHAPDVMFLDSKMPRKTGLQVAEVVATEKYVNVVTTAGEVLVRMSLRELVSRIDATDFQPVPAPCANSGPTPT